MAPLPYKFISIPDPSAPGGQTLQMIATPNVPYGTSEVSAQQYLDYVKKMDAQYATMGYGPTFWSDKYVPKDIMTQLNAGATSIASGNVMGPVTPTNTTGFYTSQAAADYAAANLDKQIPGLGTAGLSTGATPPSPVSQTLGSDAPQGGYTRDAQGNVYDAQGNHVTLDQLPKGPDGKPLMNLETLPLRDAGAGGAGPAGGAGAGGAGGSQYVSIYRDNANNFYGVDAQGNKTKLTEAQAFAGGLGINATFVQPGQTVSLAQAQTGQAGAGGTGGLDQAAIDGLHFLGMTDQQIAGMSKSDLTNWSLMGEYLKKQYDSGTQMAQINAENLQKAYQAAINDPNIIAKYSDIQKSDVANFQAGLASMQTGMDVQSARQQIQFQQQQKDLAEQYAAQGAAYSGFRQQAKGQLGTQQSGVITSSIQQAKDALRAATTPLEQFYGSQQAGSLFGGGLTYLNPLTGQRETIQQQQIGGLTGTETAQKQADIATRQQQIYQGLATA